MPHKCFTPLHCLKVSGYKVLYLGYLVCVYQTFWHIGTDNNIIMITHTGQWHALNQIAVVGSKGLIHLKPRCSTSHSLRVHITVCGTGCAGRHHQSYCSCIIKAGSAMPQNTCCFPVPCICRSATLHYFVDTYYRAVLVTMHLCGSIAAC